MSELEVQRKLTTAFIRTAPINVVLQPRIKNQTGSGGFIWHNAAPRAPQVMRLCYTSSGLSEVPQSVPGQDGVERKAEMMLLGEWNAALAVNDTFEHDGRSWVVDQIYVSNGWEQRASVIRHD